ncbi:MAG: hypothetical protein JWM72_2660 [Actinomycetia bacterium]|nr:hypothetical protein [Actinomycetes bacterium]
MVNAPRSAIAVTEPPVAQIGVASCAGALSVTSLPGSRARALADCAPIPD